MPFYIILFGVGSIVFFALGLLAFAGNDRFVLPKRWDRAEFDMPALCKYSGTHSIITAVVVGVHAVANFRAQREYIADTRWFLIVLIICAGMLYGQMRFKTAGLTDEQKQKQTWKIPIAVLAATVVSLAIMSVIMLRG